MLTNYRFNRLCAVLLSLLVMTLAGFSSIHAGDVKTGETVTIITPGVTARLCPQPMCGPDQHIMRIAEGTDLKVESIEAVKIGTLQVTWFQVVVEGNTGWVSIFDTNKAP